MEQRNYFIAVPVHTGEVRHEMAASLVGAVAALQKLGHRWYLHFLSGCSIIPDARDILASTFLRGEWTHIIWLDSDIAFPPHSFTRLITPDVEMIGGLYRFKRDIEEYPVNFFPGERWAVNPATGEPDGEGLIKTQHIPFGFCCMSRSVIEKMAKARPKTYTNPIDSTLKCYNFFDRVVEDGVSWGEDYIFCRRWREIGGDIWVDPKMHLTHIGTKHYPGHVGDFLRGLSEPESAEKKAIKFDLLKAAFSDPELRKQMRLAAGEAA